MTGPTIERLDVEGFTSIVDASVELGRFSVLVGANGTGKSNLVGVLELLGRMADEELQVHVARNGGASALVNASRPDRPIRVALSGAGHRYEVVLAPTPDGGLYFDDERIGPPGADRSIGRGHAESNLRDVPGPAAAAVLKLLGGCRVHHFHHTGSSAPVKQFGTDADNLALRSDAGNLAAVLFRLRAGPPHEQAAYRRIVDDVRQVAPFFRDFVLRPERGGQIRLRWQEHGSDAVFSAHQMSDGTLRFVCLATLLLQPTPPALIVLDEPELGLHPDAIVALADLLRHAVTGSHVVLATQCVTLINQFELPDLVVVERGPAGSIFARPDAARLRTWLDDEYPLGELWEKNLIGGPSGPVEEIEEIASAVAPVLPAPRTPTHPAGVPDDR